MQSPSDPRSFGVMAPGASTRGAYAPGREQRLPAVDDRLVAPESHAQIIGGRLIRTMGADPPHAKQHMLVARVLGACVAEGYEAAVDLLMRTDEDTDMAPDVSVFPTGTDPATGGRRTEELVIEVLSTERLGHATDRAERFVARGVRRVLSVRLKNRTVYEWRVELPGWVPLAADELITDRCLRVPITAAALLDRVAADDAVALALLGAGNAVIEDELKTREARGEAQALLRVLARRGFAIDEATRERVLACGDLETLGAWLDLAVSAATIEEVIAGLSASG